MAAYRDTALAKHLAVTNCVEKIATAGDASTITDDCLEKAKAAVSAINEAFGSSSPIATFLAFIQRYIEVMVDATRLTGDLHPVILCGKLKTIIEELPAEDPHDNLVISLAAIVGFHEVLNKHVWTQLIRCKEMVCKLPPDIEEASETASVPPEPHP